MEIQSPSSTSPTPTLRESTTEIKSAVNPNNNEFSNGTGALQIDNTRESSDVDVRNDDHQRNVGSTIEAGIEQQKISNDGSGGAEIKLSQRKKWSLLAVFSLSLVIDQWCLAAFYIFTKFISEDLNVSVEQQSWVITSYTVTFASTLLFWGRVSDLYSASLVFDWGLLSLGFLSLIISFLPEKYSFFIIRALSGIAGATSVPSSFRLIVAIFEPKELNKAFSIYGISGALAAVSGNLLAGIIQLIPSHGQAIAWRWFFRLVAAIVVPVGIGAFFCIPNLQGHDHNVSNKKSRLDLIGSGTMLVAITLLILGLTLGASSGFNKPGFIVPFIISILLFPLLLIYETKLPEEKAILPKSIWKHENFVLWLFLALLGYSWSSTNFLAFIEIWMNEPNNEKPILAAVRVLPQACLGFLISLLLSLWSKPFKYPRLMVSIGCFLGSGSYILFIFSKDQIGLNYWKFLFPGFILGSAGMMICFNMTNAGAMSAVPPSIGGVAGALVQLCFQTGTAIAFAVQAGLLTIKEGGLQNFTNTRASFIFVTGWIALFAIIFVCLYKPQKKEDGDEENRVVMAH
ncbi:uncharacterized protein L201_005521 [Kwoniella dendrophila CBS 6074]|uniref:Major facilitator superfamily (MFS) profile domain-containing protein n=1 Tax=Kwoniella dendrophila CBS 6074 TaxID=1295534 RepID=A0AAX4K160_9TREE